MIACAVFGVAIVWAGVALANEPPAQTDVNHGVNARLRYEIYDPTAFGQGPQDNGGYVLWRVAPWLALSPSPTWRFYGEAFAANVIDRTGGARPADRNDFDIGQAYLEWRPDPGSVVRFGRQEVALGSGRLLAANDGANVRRRFDGLFASRDVGRWRVLAVASGLVEVQPGIFDDAGSLDRAMAGLGAVRTADNGATLGAYAIYARRPEDLFGAPRAPQERASFGMRYRHDGERTFAEWETIVQGGEANGLDVAAWAVAGEMRWRPWESRAWAPALWLRGSIASGDSDPADDRLEAFDPLFPNPTYAGSLPLVGPTNAIALNPGLTFAAGDFEIRADAAWLSRTERADAAYAFNGRPLDASVVGGRDIGILYALNLSRRLNAGIIASATLARLDAGDYFTAPNADTTVGIISINYSWSSAPHEAQ